MDEGFYPAALANRDSFHERAVRVFDEPRQRLFHFVERGKRVKTLGALADLTGALGTAKEQDSQDRALVWLHAQHVLDAVLKLRGAPAEGFLHEVFLRQSAKCFRHFLTGEVSDWVPAGGLVAGDDKGIVGKRVAAWGEDFLF